MKNLHNKKSARTMLATIGLICTVLFTPACSNNNGTETPADNALKNETSLTTDADYRYIKTNGYPDHETGEFPNPFCPFEVSAVDEEYRMPLNPELLDTMLPAGAYIFGVALNGVAIDPAGPFWNRNAASGWEFHPATDTLQRFFGVDFNNAHTQPVGPFTMEGLYHYHGMPNGLIEELAGSAGNERMILLGYAADGFPVYNNYGLADPTDLSSGYVQVQSSYKLKAGNRASGEPQGKYDGVFVQDFEYEQGHGDLDQYNGRFAKTPEYPEGIFQYHITSAFPHSPLYFRGKPDISFRHKGPGNEMAEVPPALNNWPAQP
jgi:hypothetical protein